MLPLLMCLSLLAADPPPVPSPIRLPAVTVNTDPKPMPGPDAVTRLTTDRLYVLDSDVPVIVLSSPPGLVALTDDVGPIKVRGQFADGTGKYETRTFTGKYVYTVEASKTGRVELIVVPVGAKTAGEVIRRVIDVVAGDSPQPPQPGPGPAPTPTPGPLFEAVQAAFGADGSPTKQADKVALAAVYAAVAAQVKDPAIKTESDLAKVIGDARAARVGTRLSAVREIIGREFGKVLPPDATATLTDADRKAVRVALTRFSTLLEAIK